jgi:hypothetical protein
MELVAQIPAILKEDYPRTAVHMFSRNPTPFRRSSSLGQHTLIDGGNGISVGT